MLSNTATDKMGPRVMTPLCTTGWLIMALFWSSCWIMPLQWVISFLPRSLRTPWFILALYDTHTQNPISSLFISAMIYSPSLFLSYLYIFLLSHFPSLFRFASLHPRGLNSVNGRQCESFSPWSRTLFIDQTSVAIYTQLQSGWERGQKLLQVSGEALALMVTRIFSLY